MPFGLASAPRCFTKILATIAAHLRLMPVRLQAYQDDILVQASSLSRAQEDLNITIWTLRDHGFLVNCKMSHLTPNTMITHLGAIIDTKLGEVFLSQERPYKGSNSSDPAEPQDSLSHPVRAIRQDGVMYANSTLGPVTCKESSVVLATIPMGTYLKFPKQGQGPLNSQEIPPLVDILSGSH